MANNQFVQKIRDPRNVFGEMEQSPLRNVDYKYGVPELYFELLDQAREKLMHQDRPPKKRYSDSALNSDQLSYAL